MKFRHQATFVLYLLLSIDLLFIALHVVNALTPLWNNPLLNIEKDGGYSEFYQYLKYLGAAVCMLLLCSRTRSLPCLAWVVLFSYLLADDWLGFHEEFGGLIAAQLSGTPPFGLRLQDIGELLFALLTALGVCLPLAWAFLKGSPLFRQSFVHLLQLTLLLGFFGVVADLVHMTIQSGWKMKFLLALVEDGGEMFAASALLAYCSLLLRGNGMPPRQVPWGWLWSPKSSGSCGGAC